MKVDLVIARYNEDIHWIKRLPLNKIRTIFIYNKGDQLDLSGFTGININYSNLPNVGNEAGTYLHHLAELVHYDSDYNESAEYIAFLQGNPFDHMSEEQLHTLLLDAQGDFTWLAGDYGDCDGDAWPHHVGLRLREIYAATFSKASPNHYHFGIGGQFMVRLAHVLKKPYEFYKHAEYVVSYGFPKTYAPWCAFERYWDKIFE